MIILRNTLTLFCLLLVIPPVAAQSLDPESWSPTWINPAWERPANMLPDSAISLPGDLAVDQLESPTLCGGCHNEIFEQWQGGVHANALNDPIFQKVTKLRSRSGRRRNGLSAGVAPPITIWLPPPVPVWRPSTMNFSVPSRLSRARS